ncbi:WD40-repeat-containing domain protein [Gigaspora rosea]|uniref:WD40-repeat-containing domain protein n=1 Tax=Gigaspora rosea TaxID=44941 RepID=A0A397UFU0_9GLOM|nr:WD40-repeat-containing domain protein [Gigaspora rosea]
MISSLLWIRKGAAAEQPERYELDDREYERISKLTAAQVETAKNELENHEVKMVDENNNPELLEYNLEQYDEEDEEEGQPMSIFGNVKGLTYYTSNEEDPYITLNDEDDESDDGRILATDSVLVAAKTEDEISQLEIYVYEDSQDNLYVHNDIMLPSFPLCLEWLDFRLGRKESLEGRGNYVAVGTFEPEIEIWDLDVSDSMYPDAILGSSNKEHKKKKKKKKPNSEHHTDAVMGLSWNKHQRNLLASSSADTTVKLWDLQSLKCAHSYDHHKDKVQQVEWHLIEPTIMLTASFDKTVVVFDSRAPNNVASWNLENADPECVRWDPFSPQYFYVSTESGLVLCFDARNSDKIAPVFTLHAHDAAVTSLDVNRLVKGCMITGSTDKMVKVWDIKDMKPTIVTSRDLGVGKVFAAQFCLDLPFHLAVSGSGGNVHIWDLSTNAGVRSSFKESISTPFEGNISTVDKTVSVLQDEESEHDDDDDDNNEIDLEEIDNDSGDDV